MYRDIVKKTNPITFQMIKNAVESNKVSHAFIFSAPKNYEIENEWKFLVESLISKNPFNDSVRNYDTYPDLIIIDGSEKIIKKENVINALNKMQETPLEENGKKILVIKNIDNANKQSLNSLLKFIEEPTSNTFIILTTNNISKVLTTIKSRSQVISLKSPSYEKLKEAFSIKYGNDAKLLARITSNLSEAEDKNILIQKYKQEFIDAVDDAITNLKKAYSIFSNLLNKENYSIILNMLRVFFNDVWRYEEDFECAFDKEIVSKYALSKFNYSKALEVVNDFIISIDSNVNFNLYKSRSLILLGECYE